MIYTSYYAKHGSNPKAIGISYSVPKWFDKSRHLCMLAPTWDLVGGYKDGSITQQEYTTRYVQLLEGREIDPMGIAHNLPEGTILLCYERPGDFCHRRVLAEWVEQTTGVKIPEWKDPEQEKKDQIVDDLLNF